MSSGQWEVVGRNKKDKINNQNKKTGKPDKKKVVPAPKVEDILPLSQVKNIYSNMAKSNKENKKPQEKDNKPKEPAAKKPAPKKEKPQETPKKKPSKSIESALNTFNVDELKSSLEMSKERFPDAPLVWLKELAAFLNSKLAVELNDPVFTTKPDNYPLNIMPSGVKQIMDRALHDAGKASAQVFFDITMTAMANDMSKGLAAIGHKIWLQFLALNNPLLTVAHLDKMATLRTSYQNRQPIGLSILWALGQGGFKDFHIGLKVFKEFMLPLLEMKNYARFISRYLTQLLNRHSSVGISKEVYLFLFDVINTKRSLPNEVTQDLNALNKQLKAILFSKNADKKYSVYFETLLVKLTTSNISVALRNDINDTLLNCLIKDTSCFNTWKQIYRKQYQPSCILIKYMRDNWRKFLSQTDKNQVKDLLNCIIATNTELMTKNKKDASLQDSTKICKALLDKMTVSKKSFPWKFLIFVLFLTTTSLFIYDVNKHGSWKKTQSVRTLKQIGVWEYGEKAWDSAHQGYNWTRQRIEEYAPGSVEYLDQYIELGRDMWIISVNAANKVVESAAEKYPVVIASIESYAPGVLEKIGESWNIVSTKTVEYSYKGYNYLATEVFVGQLSPENMHKTLLNAFDTTQRYAVEYYNWAYEKVQSMVQGK